mgnify:CR=1 FL=1
MEFNRNHYLVVGVIIFLLGLQLRLVESYTLNEHFTKLINVLSSHCFGNTKGGAKQISQ